MGFGTDKLLEHWAIEDFVCVLSEDTQGFVFSVDTKNAAYQDALVRFALGDAEDEQTCLKNLRSDPEFTWGTAWEEQIKAVLLWRVCRESVVARNRARLSAWCQVRGQAKIKGFIAGTYGEQHVKAALAYLKCAELALKATLLLWEYPPPKDALIALLHAAADIVALPCDRNVDHGLLHTALEAQQTFVETDAHPDRQGTQEHALAPLHAVDMVFNILASKAYGPSPPVARAWAWDVTRTLLGAERHVVFSCEVTVAGTARDQGVLPTLTLEVLEPGRGEVYFTTQETPSTRTRMMIFSRPCGRRGAGHCPWCRRRRAHSAPGMAAGACDKGESGGVNR